VRHTRSQPQGSIVFLLCASHKSTPWQVYTFPPIHCPHQIRSLSAKLTGLQWSCPHQIPPPPPPKKKLKKKIEKRFEETTSRVPRTDQVRCADLITTQVGSFSFLCFGPSRPRSIVGPFQVWLIVSLGLLSTHFEVWLIVSPDPLSAHFGV
jgi:hypothetical protein